MSACRDYLDFLSEALDRPLWPEDQAQLEAHLKDCPACRAAQEELRWVQGQLQSLEGVEPPPWMTAKIMARVRAEAAPSFWRRLLLPMVLNPQFQVATILLVAATGYFLTRTQSPEAIAPARIESQQELKATESPDASQEPEVAPPMDSRRRKAPAEAPAKLDAPAPSEDQEKREEEVKEKDNFAPAPAKALQESVAPSPQAPVASEAAGVAPGSSAPSRGGGAWLAARQDRDDAADKKARKAAETRATGELGKVRSGVAQPAQMPGVIRLAPANLQTVKAEAEAAVRRVGGSLLQDPQGLTVRLDSRRLKELVVLLGRTSRVLEHPGDPGDEPGQMTIQIRW
jgi:hypothetical protein